jgi:GNAT superfamily N-acetyltransferase
MIAHVKDAETYATLKLRLAEQFKEDINNYVIGKDKLVQKMDAQAKLWSERRKDYLPNNTSKKLNEDQLMKAIIANLNVHMTYFAQYLKEVELIRIPGYTIVNSGLTDDTFNYVLDVDFSEAVAIDKINEITQYFKNTNAPFSWWISPYDKPSSLSTLLEKNGYQNTENNIAMYFDLDSWKIPTQSTTPELKIIRALDENTLHDFALVLANDKHAFKTYFSWIAAILTDDDPIEYYVGYVDDKPVVRGLSCYYASVAGLHWLSTTPDARKKGYGTAMQEYRLKRAKELGYHIAVLQASNEGYSLYRRLGYKECGIFKEYKLRNT